MTTQSADTHPGAEKVLIELQRGMSPAEKLNQVRSLSRVAIALIAALATASAAAQQGAASDDDLAAQATDPTAQLMSFQLNDAYAPDYHGLDDTSNRTTCACWRPRHRAGRPTTR